MKSNKLAISLILGFSVLAVGILFWVVYFNQPVFKNDVAFLSDINAFLNITSAILVLLGLVAIKNKQKNTHRNLMILAVISSGLFLISYLTYHYLHGNTTFNAQGWIRPVYFLLLISHILMSIVALPLILSAVYFAITKKFIAHKRIVKYTYPVWLYVSISGVLVYIFLKMFN